MPNQPWIPSRSDKQYARDRGRTAEQVRQLGAPRQSFMPNTALDELLWTRHAKTSGALQFDIVQRAEGGEAFVVSRELLVSKSDKRLDADDELTKDRSFVRRPFPADDPCGSLHELVWLYSYPSGTDEEARRAVDDAVASLRSQEMDVAPTGVAALQMVLKSTDGPSPTWVTVDPFPEEGAALPSGDVKTVAVIDTGIDKEMREDGWLNEVDRDNNDANVDELDVFQAVGIAGMPVLDFGAGHGTFAAGIIRQVDPQAHIVVYRALDTDGVGSEEAVACAMIRAADAGAHVISLSLGMQAVNGILPVALKAAVDYIEALSDPPAIVAAAGNNGTDEPVYPAAFPEVVSVAALQGVDLDTGQVPDGAEWSSYGDWVRCSTVGEGVVSTFVKGREDQQFGGNDVYPERGQDDSWAVWSGTSFAAPQIAACIARKCREEGLSPRDAVADLFPAGNAPMDGFGTRMVLLEGTRP
jgi:hypothetical protein